MKIHEEPPIPVNQAKHICLEIQRILSTSKNPTLDLGDMYIKGRLAELKFVQNIVTMGGCKDMMDETTAKMSDLIQINVEIARRFPQL